MRWAATRPNPPRNCTCRRPGDRPPRHLSEPARDTVMPNPKRPDPRPTQLQGITDLTVFADIKPGLIDGIFDSRSWLWRLQRVLDLLDNARRANREADVALNPF